MRTLRSTTALFVLLSAASLLAAPVRAGAAPPGPAPAAVPAAQTLHTAGPTVGPVRLRWLPAGLGEAWRGSPYTFDDVDLESVVWESPRPDGTGWRTDAHVTVMTSPRFTTPRAVHDWVIGYQQRPADEVRYRPVSVRGRPAWLTRDQVFWWPRPGLVVSVTLDPERWSTVDVLRVARSAVVGGRAPRDDARGVRAVARTPE